ncbi:YibE/F family protein [uncultured Treponema sp.]|uniref:YibE/F family protein n=1 Tax=uncultured Treponema sp. TaxID=162155 RepID=UPI0015C1553A|nr:YibE/F family protein [uncultured Treponema sp.]
MRKISRSTVSIMVSIACIILMAFIPTGFEGAVQFKDAVKCRAKILETDNSRFVDTGLIRTGQQVCTVLFLSGRFKGQVAEGWNMLNGSLSQDKVFRPGDKAQALVQWEFLDPQNPKKGSEQIISVNLIDHYRLKGELVLALGFCVFLVAFAGATGVRSVLSFIITVLALWKILVPLYLKGFDPLFTGLSATAFLCVIIIALVYGFDRRLFCAAGGAMLGIIFCALLSILCTKAFKIHGAVMAYSESLLYSGYLDLNLTKIFMSSICIGASGSVMDLAVDITSAVREVVKNCPSITRLEAVKSGLAVARAAMGTMTTTLLLAYSGTCIALLMTFMAQGTPVYNILNNNQVAAEIINTVAGSFGLAATAPFTAFLSGIILAGKKA